MGQSLWNAAVFLNSTPGVVLADTTDPANTSAGPEVIDNRDVSRRSNNAIETEYIVSGETAYIGFWRYNTNGIFDFTLAPNNTDPGGGQAGPEFTDDFETNGLIALRLNNGTVYTSEMGHLTSDDATEPYQWSAASVAAAGDANDAALRSAVGAATSAQILLVLRTHANIDADNLETIDAPLAPAAPTLAETVDSITVTLAADPTSDATIDSRDIQWKETVGNTWTEVTGITSPYTISSLSESTEYEVQWRAVSTAGDGAWSPSGTITTSSADLMPSLPPIFSQSATVGTAFSLTFAAATGGDPPLTYTVSGNPSWLTLSNRTLSGTPTATGTQTVTVTVEDNDGDTAFRAFLLTVGAAADLMPTLAAIDDIDVEQGDVEIEFLPTATGGDTPITYALTGGPSDLTFTASTRRLRWAAQSSVSSHDLTYTATDNDGDVATQTFTIRSLLALDNFSVPSGQVEVDVALITSGRDAGDWLYRDDTGLGTLVDGTIEPESGYPMSRIRHAVANQLQLNDNPDAADVNAFFSAGGAGNDLVIYVQDRTGVSSFTVADVTLLGGGNFARFTVPNAFETVLARIDLDDRFILAFTRVSVTDQFPTAPTVSNKSGTVGDSFSTTLPVGTGGDTPLSYSVSGEPSWASFNTSTRVLSGTPTAAATTTVTYTVEDDDGDTDSTTFDIVVSAATPDDLMPSLPAIFSQSATVGTFFTLTFSAATGGDTPLSYSVSGNPAWLTLSNRTLSGTPTATGSHTVVVTVEDNDGDTASRTFILTVTAAADLMPTAGNTTNKSYAVDTDFSFTLVAGTGGDGTLAITVAGLPTGTTFDGTDTITGNVSTAGTHTITATYTDDDGDTDDDTFVLTLTSASTTDSTTYRFENIDLSSDALEDVFTRFSGVLTTAGSWAAQATGVTPTSNTGPGTNSSGPYVYSESSASSGPAEILTNSKLVMLSSIMDTWTGTDRSITLRVCIQGTGWSADDEGLRIITGTTEADSTQLVRLTGWDYSNSYTVGNTITNRQDDDYTIVQVGGWIDYTIDIPDGHEYFELASFIVALGSFHLHDLALWQIILTNGAGDTVANTAPSISFTTATSTVEGESTTTISGTVSDTEDANGSVTVTASTTLGSVSTPVNSSGTWSLVLTAPSVTTSQQSMAVTVMATDSGSLTDTASRTWTVRANRAPTVTITTSDGEHNGGSTVDLDATVSAPETGQSVTVLWEITSGTGTLSNSTSATLASITLPNETAAEQSITIRITATDALNSTATDSVTLTIPAAATVDLATPTVDDEEALLGIAYSRTLPEVDGETGTITRTATGLPTGLSFNATTRVLSGTPTSTGTYTVTYTITDDDDSDSTNTTFDITIANEISLLARSITASLAGIALAGNVNPTLTPSSGSGTTVNIVSAGAGSRRIDSTIDSKYVDSSPAYLTNFYFNANNGVLHVGSTPSTSIQISGVDFNEDGFDDLGIAVGTSGGDEYGWRIGDLVGSDTTAPYAFSSGNLGTAGDTNTNALRSNIGNDDDTKVVLADRTDPNIDWSNLTYSPTPSLPAVDDIEVYVGGSVSETLPVGSGDQVPLSYSVATLPSWLSFNTTTRALSGTVPANTYDADEEISLTYTIEDGGGTTDTSTITIRILLSLEHFIAPSGQEIVTSALYERGSVSGVSAFFYRDDDRDSGGDTTDVGVLVDGELEPETGYYISRVRYRADGLLQFNDNPDADNLESFFGTTGNGNDLIVSIQDSQGVESFVVADATVNSASGGNLVVWEVPDAFNDILIRISSASTGEQFIVAMTRAADVTPSLPSISDQTATVSTEFSLTFDAATSGNAPLAYSVSGNPAWLTLSDRTLSGTPAATGTHTVVVTVTDNDGDTDTSSFSLVVSAADLTPTAPTIDDQTATVGTAYTQTLDVGTGGNTPLIYSASGIPAGLSFNVTTRVLSGTPTTAQTYTVTYTVEDDDGDTDDSTFDIVVSAALTGTSLWDDSVFLNSTPGVAWLHTATNPQDTGSADTLIIGSNDSTRRASELIDADYVVGGVGYVTELHFFDSGNVDLNFATTVDDSDNGNEAGPQLTTDGQNIGIALRLNNGDILQFPITDITSGDSTEPFKDPVPGVSATFTQALLDNPPIQCIFVDITHANIDWDNLRAVAAAVAPLVPTAPTLTATETSIEVTLSTDPTSDATIDSRDIQWKTTAGSVWTEVIGVTSPHTISSLSEGTEYEVQWRAVSTIGDGAWSPSGTITTTTDLMPSLPAIADQSATVGTVYSLTFAAATGGDTPLAYSVSGNPAWLTLSGRVLSGTPDATGTYTITVTVTDDDDDTDDDSFVLTVAAASTTLQLSDFVVPTGHELATSALIEAGAADFLYRDDDPTAVETSDSGEILDGDIIPATDYRMSLIRHPDANGFILNDRPEAASIITFFESGGDGADLTIHVQDDTGVASFVVADTTIFASSDDFIRYTVPDAVETVLDRIGSGDLFIIAFTRPTTTVDLLPTAPTVANQTGTVGTAFSATLPVGTGGDTPLAYSISGEPSWVSFNTTSRLLSGTPDAAGVSTIVYTVTDDDGDTDTDSFTLTIVTAADLMPTLPAIIDQGATVGTAFSLIFAVATGGDAPLAYSVSGNPAWLTLSDRTLSGTPTATGTHTITVTVTDDDGDTDSSSFTLTAHAADLTPSLPAIDDQSATVGTAFSLTFDAATSGNTPLVYSVSSNPSWLTLSDLVLSGTPTAAGTHTITVTVTDTDGDTDTSSFVLTVVAADATPSLPVIANQGAVVGTAFSLTFAAATGGDAPLSYSVAGNPAWLTLSGRVLSGTPTAIGTSTIIVTVTDDDGDIDTASFTLTVAAIDLTPSLAATSDQTFTVGDVVNLLLPAATGGNTPITYEAVGLPSDLSFSASTRRITGTLSIAGTSTIVYLATDSDGDEVEDEFTITVNADVPSRPDAPTVARSGSDGLRATWVAPANNGTPITSYDVRYREDGTTAWTRSNDLTFALVYLIVAGFGTNLRYEFQVRATNSVGNGPWSSSGYGTTASDSLYTELGTYEVQADWDRDGNYAHSQSNLFNYMVQATIHTKRGRDYGSQFFGRSVAGQTSLRLRNEGDEFDRFSPDSDLFGYDLIGTPVRLVMENVNTSGIYHTLWSGSIDRINFKQRRSGQDEIVFVCRDIIVELSETDASAPAGEDVTTENAVRLLLDSGGIATDRIGTIEGNLTMGRWWSPLQSVLRSIRQLEETEGGFFWIDVENRINFDSSTNRATASARISQLTLDDSATDIIDLKPEDPLKDVTNVVKVPLRQFSIAEEAELWSLGESFPLEPEGERTFLVEYPDEGAPRNHLAVESWVDIEAGVDYTANNSSSDSGDDRIDDIIVTTEDGGNSRRITIENTDANDTIYVTLLKSRGNVIQEDKKTIVEVRNQDSIDKYGIKDYTSPSQYLSTVAQAHEYGTALLYLYSETRLKSKVRFQINTDLALAYMLELSDRVTMVRKGESEDQFIECIEHFIEPGLQHDIQVTLSPAAQYGDIIILGTGPPLGTGILGR